MRHIPIATFFAAVPIRATNVPALASARCFQEHRARPSCGDLGARRELCIPRQIWEKHMPNSQLSTSLARSHLTLFLAPPHLLNLFHSHSTPLSQKLKTQKKKKKNKPRPLPTTAPPTSPTRTASSGSFPRLPDPTTPPPERSSPTSPGGPWASSSTGASPTPPSATAARSSSPSRARDCSGSCSPRKPSRC